MRYIFRILKEATTAQSGQQQRQQCLKFKKLACNNSSYKRPINTPHQVAITAAPQKSVSFSRIKVETSPLPSPLPQIQALLSPQTS